LVSTDPRTDRERERKDFVLIVFMHMYVKKQHSTNRVFFKKTRTHVDVYAQKKKKKKQRKRIKSNNMASFKEQRAK
jgi:hypothetical protein